MAAIDNDDTSGHYEASFNVFAYSMMGESERRRCGAWSAFALANRALTSAPQP